MSNIRIMVADDHQLFRAGLKSILEQHGGFEVVGEAIDGQSALALARECAPDIILLDISMPGLNGIEVLRRFQQEGVRCKVMILSMHSDQKFVTESIKAGARGYLLKDSAMGELVSGIKAVVAGEVYLSSRVAGLLVNDYVAIADQARTGSALVLSSREREVLQLIAEGKNTKEAAARLNLSAKTIEAHRKNIMDKLNLHSVAELTQYAIREKIISVD